MDSVAVELRSVADVISETVKGQKVETIRFHKTPTHRAVPASYFPIGTTLEQANASRQDLEKPVPADVTGINLSWEVATEFIGYDERCGRTVDFTAWTEDWVIQHIWMGAGGPTTGGQVLKLLVLPRHPSVQ